MKWVTPSASISARIAHRIDRAQHHVRAARAGDRPREAPAVAVEERQRPEEHAVAAEPVHVHLAERVQERAAVRVHHALRPARGARGVVERGDPVLVVDVGSHREDWSAVHELGVARAVERAPGDARDAILHVHEPRACAEPARHTAHRARELRVAEHELRARVVQDVADLLGLEARVDRHERGAHLQHREVGDEQLRNVRREERDAVAGRDASAHERAREPADLLGEAPVAPAQLAVHHGRLVREDAERPLEQTERRHRIQVNGSATGIRHRPDSTQAPSRRIRKCDARGPLQHHPDGVGVRTVQTPAGQSEPRAGKLRSRGASTRASIAPGRASLLCGGSQLG